MKKTDKPFLIINEEGLHIHPEFTIVFNFLMQIEGEIKELMTYQRRLRAIKRQCSELLKVMAQMQPGKDFKETTIENPVALADKFKFIRPIRSEFIVLFAHLETLRCLQVAYEKMTADDRELRKASEKEMDDFIKKFCLSKENPWITANPKRAGKLSASNIRRLRNSLTHFFSVDKKIGIAPTYDVSSEKITNQTNNKVQILSPEDFEKILEGAGKLMLVNWSEDCKKSLKNGDDNFSKKMSFVKDVVTKNGAIFITENNL